MSNPVPPSTLTDSKPVPTPPKANRKRLLELDAFRGIASFGVLLYHYYYYYFEIIGDPADGIQGFSAGQYGVELFFMLSGFVIFMSLEHSKRIIDFAVSRLARLFPVYWLSILITSIVVHSFGLDAREPSGELASRAVGLIPTLANFTMLEEYAGFAKVDGAYWTLTLELSFYFVIAAAYFSGLLKRFHLAAGAAISFFAVLWGAEEFASFHLPFKIKTLFLVGYGHLFLLGMLLYRHWKSGSNGIGFAFMACCIALQFQHGALLGGLVAGFTGLFIAFIKGWLEWITWKPLLFLGSISYSLYIVHQYVGYVLMRELLERGFGLRITQVIALIAAILIATGMTYSVEKPAAKLVRNWWKSRSSAT